MNTHPPSSRLSPRALLGLAFAAVYLFWGSTYLGMRLVVESLPPFGTAGLRFMIAGAILYAVLRQSGQPAPERAHWKTAAVVGPLLILGGNVPVALAVQWIDSGLAAVLVATTPLYLTLLGWWTGLGRRPGVYTSLGLVVGLVGIAVLINPNATGEHVLRGTLLALVAPLCWSLGTIHGKRSAQPPSAVLFAAMQMFVGGLFTLLFSFLILEPTRISWLDGTATSWWAFLYLIVFGALLGFPAYVYVTKHTSPAAGSSYAYVNPVIAVLLGSVLLGETLDARTLVGSALTLGAVALILWRQAARSQPALPVTPLPSPIAATPAFGVAQRRPPGV